MVAAVLLGLVGVPHEEIADDYHAHRRAPWPPSSTGSRSTYPEAIDAMTSQPPEYLEAPREAMLAFLDHVDERHGSIEGLVRELGVPERRRSIASASPCSTDAVSSPGPRAAAPPPRRRPPPPARRPRPAPRRPGGAGASTTARWCCSTGSWCASTRRSARAARQRRRARRAARSPAAARVWAARAAATACWVHRVVAISSRRSGALVDRHDAGAEVGPRAAARSRR